MTTEQRLDRVERLLLMVTKAGFRTGQDLRQKSREQDEKMDILIDMQIRQREWWLAEQQAINEQAKRVQAAQERTDKALAELAEEHKLTERALRDFLAGQRKGRNGRSTN